MKIFRDAGLRRHVYLAIALVIVLQSCVTFLVVPFLLRYYPMYNDRYDRIAMNLVQGYGYRTHEDTAPTMVREPGYILVLAALFSFYPNDPKAVELVNVVLALLTAVCTALVARRMGLSDGAAFLAAIMFLLDPAVALAESRAGPEILFTFLVTTVLLQLYRTLKSGRWLDFLLLGITIGLASLVRGVILLFPIFLIPLFLIRVNGTGRRGMVLWLALLLAGTVSVMTPWVLRNYMISGAFVPAGTVVGSVAQEALYISQKGFTEKTLQELEREAYSARIAVAKRLGVKYRPDWQPSFYSAKDEVAFNRILLSEVIKEYRKHPTLLYRTIVDNAWGFLFRGGTRIKTVLNVLLMLPFLIASIFGIVIGRRQGVDIVPALVFVLYFYVMHLPLLAVTRFHIPLTPVMVIMSAIFLVAGLGRFGFRVPVMRPKKVLEVNA